LEYLSQAQREIVELSMTMSQVDIAQKTGKKQEYISRLLNHNKRAMAYREELDKAANAIAIENLSKGKRKLRENAEKFAQNIIDIAQNSEDENVRLRASEKGLLFSGATLGAQDDMTMKIPELKIRQKEKKEEHPVIEEAKKIINE